MTKTKKNSQLPPKYATDEHGQKILNKEFFAAIGRNGGQATKKKYGTSHFSKAGRKGGHTVKRLQDPGYYSTIGRMGGTHNKKKGE